ncbi:uncharacterized protein LOC131008286 [Salvia miltiorrhiza]|uniref:uncharacterized protein LOC131008286 n=1 Tax=Salvia miltiorrhiza TaxID=226208 RepID=UPI0025ACC824|nr:uncharacterized protein LOC131008286 [Salvia miltiorrhiza]
MPCSWIYISFLSTCICTVHAFSFSNSTTVSYTDHCSSVVPQSIPNNCTYKNFIPRFITPHFTGGESLIGRKAGNQPNQNLAKSLLLEFQPKFNGTAENGIYKVEALLHIMYAFPFYHIPGYTGSYYETTRDQEAITFLLEGFWSQISGNLCMVGSAYLELEGGCCVNLDAVLKLNYAAEDNPSVYTSLISGTLHSTLFAGDLAYFDPILIYNFPVFPNYTYSLVPKELNSMFLNDYVFPKDRSLSLESSSFCSVVTAGQAFLELEYAVECSDSQHCSPLGDRFSQFLPPFLYMLPLQCCEDKRELRYLAKFRHNNFAYNKTFNLDWTLIVEASWDDETNQLFGAACQILNPADHFGNAVGDCTMRLSLRYPSILDIRNEARIVGQIWSSKTAEESGYFRRISLTDTSENRVVALGHRYEYTEMDRARESCPVKKFEKNGKTYPVGNSYTMSTRFDVFVEGQKCGWGSAVPFCVGAEIFEVDPRAQPEPMIRSENALFNISYKISINLYSEAKWPKINPHREMIITAEGEYDSETGYVCMVGCRKLRPQIQSGSTYAAVDCDIVVKFEFDSLDNNGAFLKGSIESTTSQADPLHFPDLSLLSPFPHHDFEVNLPPTWRLNVELSMLVTSNALSCLFVWLQIRHVRRHTEVASSISLLMILILSLGHIIISVAFNFKILFPSNQKEQTFQDSLLKNDKVASMVISVIEFALHIRLFYVVWNAKSNQGGSWIRERAASLVSVSLCISVGLLSSRPYAGLMLDGFLLPQILLSILGDSTEKALCAAFYAGMSAVRSAPHAYNQYRKHNYPALSNVDQTFYYANPAADFYSAAWDVIIPCGVIALAAIVFLQQRHGARCLLPPRFKALLQWKYDSRLM